MNPQPPDMGRGRIGEVCFPQGSLRLDISIFACAIFSNICYFSSYNIILPFLRIVGTLGHSNRIHDHMSASRRQWRCPSEFISRIKSEFGKSTR